MRPFGTANGGSSHIDVPEGLISYGFVGRDGLDRRSKLILDE